MVDQCIIKLEHGQSKAKNASQNAKPNTENFERTNPLVGRRNFVTRRTSRNLRQISMNDAAHVDVLDTAATFDNDSRKHINSPRFGAQKQLRQTTYRTGCLHTE